MISQILCIHILFMFFFSSRRRHTRLQGDWSSDVCSSDLLIKNFDDAIWSGYSAALFEAVNRSAVTATGTVTKIGPVHPRVIETHEHIASRSEEHTSELQSPCNLVCRLLLEKKKITSILFSHTPFTSNLAMLRAPAPLANDAPMKSIPSTFPHAATAPPNSCDSLSFSARYSS